MGTTISQISATPRGPKGMDPEQWAEELRRLPTLQARLTRTERYRNNDRWGDIDAQSLATVLSLAARGEIWDWADLVEYAVTTDPYLVSLYTTRVTRVVQADYVVEPNSHGDQQLAKLAAEFIDEQLGRAAA